jgi:hypothetical protein
LIPRDICARPNTIEMVTIRQPRQGEPDTLITKTYNTMTSTRYINTKTYNHISGARLNSSTTKQGRLGRDRMVVGFTTTCAISAYHH